MWRNRRCQEGGVFRHDTARIASMIGNGISRQVIRRWARKKRVTGAYQREENAKVWLNDEGVLEVWTLWAEYRDLDFEKDMPTAVRKVRDKLGVVQEGGPKAPKDDRLSSRSSFRRERTSRSSNRAEREEETNMASQSGEQDGTDEGRRLARDGSVARGHRRSGRARECKQGSSPANPNASFGKILTLSPKAKSP